ncbi:DUF6984 family protein [Variovorax paradoxus]|uniref:DUF6984 family protein n=1 Tax=Variovorax paradoxus TaxID=34073 RepID=UPI0029C780A7|nr:hypothetical protein RZE77_29565 [Variovorax paradoxus]
MIDCLYEMSKSRLKQEERYLIKQYAELLPLAAQELILADLQVAQIKECASNRSWIIFSIPGYERPIYQGQHTVEVEGKLLDKDGAEVSAILYVDENNRLYELEFVRWDANELIDLQWSTLEIFH